MARKVWNYSMFSNVNGGSDVLAKLRTFALANGWTAPYYETSVSWASDGDGTYSFAHAGDEDHLELRSNGYGGQTMIFRFRNDPQDAQSDHLFCMAIDPANGTVNESSSTRPDHQNDMNYTTDEWNTIPNSSFPELVIVGDETFIAVHMRVTTLLTLTFAFGTYELLPGEQSTDDLIFWWNGCTTSAGNWYDYTTPGGVQYASFYTPLYAIAYNYYLDGTFYDNGRLKPFLRFPSYDGAAATFYWMDLRTRIAANNFSGFRTFISIPVAVINASSVWRVIGHFPFYYIPWGGLDWGEIIYRGSEQYLALPVMWFNQKYGIAYRVA